MSGDVERHERVEIARTISVRHAETTVVPKRILIFTSVVDPLICLTTLAVDAVSSKRVLVKGPCVGQAIMRVCAGGVRIAVVEQVIAEIWRGACEDVAIP